MNAIGSATSEILMTNQRATTIPPVGDSPGRVEIAPSIYPGLERYADTPTMTQLPSVSA